MEEGVKYIDLFCGMGSFHHSLSRLQWQCVMACDINKSVRDTYFANYALLPLGDIVEIDPTDVPEYDVLCAGFPCQPWSNIGKRQGLDDERGSMFQQVMKFVKRNTPKIIILENVKGLLSQDNGQPFQHMVEEIKYAGYQVNWKVLACNDYGIPQMRKRLFVVGVRDEFIDIENVFSFERIDTPTLSNYLGRNFAKSCAYTVRCGGRRSPIDDKHNWDGYMVDGEEYRLTKSDCLKLQGFPDSYQFKGTNTDVFKMLGNTIPTNLTFYLGKHIAELMKLK